MHSMAQQATNAGVWLLGYEAIFCTPGLVAQWW